ncbi:unnamed protein product [Rhodiola kirilowii]
MKEIARWWVDVVRDVDDEENHNAAAAPASQAESAILALNCSGVVPGVTSHKG